MPISILRPTGYIGPSSDIGTNGFKNHPSIHGWAWRILAVRDTSMSFIISIWDYMKEVLEAYGALYNWYAVDRSTAIILI